MPNPVYCIPANLDLNDPEHLLFLLHQDKHTRIEGLCSEVAFMEDVVSDQLCPVTTDFWFTRFESSYRIQKILTSAMALPDEPDYHILDYCSKINPSVPVSIVHFNEEDKTFTEVRHQHGRRYDTWEGIGEKLPRIEKLPELAMEKDRNPERTTKACAWLAARGLLKAAAIKRMFANCWLTGGVWDVDAFTRTTGNRIVALEVKQKYRTQIGTFGLNNGQRNLFLFLIKNGIPVIHIILQKPKPDSTISAIDLLTLPQYTDHTEWLFTRFLPEKMKDAVTSAPRHTSIHGHCTMPYGHISADRFAVLKKFGVRTTDISACLLEGLE